jgi:hypothetical protein
MSEQDGLFAAMSSAIQARRHPWVLTGLWAWQTALALAASWPAASLVRATFGAGPRGDAPLWDPGGHALIDFVWHNARGLAPVIASVEVTLVVGAVAGLFPTAAAMFAMTRVARSRRRAEVRARWVDIAARAMPSFLSLLLVMSLAQAIAIGAGVLVGEGVQAWFQSGLGEVRAQCVGVAVCVVFVGVASGLGVVHDLARAAVVRSRLGALRALVVGARIFGAAPLPMWWSWAWRALLSLAPVLGASTVATRVGGRGGVALLLIALLHQAVILSRVALRASWLAKALRSVDPPHSASWPSSPTVSLTP